MIREEVRVTLPLLRGMPKTADSNGSGTTPKSNNSSMSRETDESISLLQGRVMGQKVALYGFDSGSRDSIVQEMAQLLKASIMNFLANWYGLQIVPYGQKVNFIIANEATPNVVSQLTKPPMLKDKGVPVLVLCSHSSRFDREYSQSKTKTNLGFVAKPIGPLKLARALLQVLEGTPVTPGFIADPSISLSPGNTDLTNVFEELTISPEVLDNSRMAADSVNARKAIESPTPTAAEEKHVEFPFPADTKPSSPDIHSMPGDCEGLRTLPRPTDPKVTLVNLASTEHSSTASHSSGTTSVPKSVLSGPRLLLVDDNKINLTLLRTYMRKRKYTLVDEAENGLEAVKKVQEREDFADSGYDIIFMDIRCVYLRPKPLFC